MCEGNTKILSMEGAARKERNAEARRQDNACIELKAIAKLMSEGWDVAPVNASGSDWVATYNTVGA